MMATRDIQPHEVRMHLASPRRQEILYSYGSSKPFEHQRKQQLEAVQHSRKRGRDVCRFVWVPHEDA